MNDISYITFSSGFSGVSGKLNPPLSQVQIARAMLERTEIPKHKLLPFSTEVEKLWGDWINRNVDKSNFDFIERVITTAILHMGDTDVMSWLRQQDLSYETGAQHAIWLKETIGFVMAGYRRHTHCAAWCFVLTAGDNAKEKNIIGDNERKLLGEKVVYGAETMSMRKFLIHWIRRPGGLGDLVESLKILYGQR